MVTLLALSLVVGVLVGNSGGYALSFWLPTTVKNLSGGSDQMTLLYSGIYYSCGILSVLISGQTADRTGDRKWHAAGGMIEVGSVSRFTMSFTS